MSLRIAGRVPLAIALAAPLGVLMVLGSARIGNVALLMPVAAVMFAVLALHLRLALALLICSVVMFEEDAQGFLPFPQVHNSVAGPLRLSDILILTLIAGVALRVTLRGEPLRTPGPLLLPLLLFVGAVAVGLVMAAAGDPDPEAVFGTLRDLFSLAVLPFLVVNVLTDPRDLRRGLLLLLGLVIFKSAVGAIGYLLGVGRVVEGTVLTYYAPAANLLLLAFVLTMIAAMFARARLHALVWCMGPLALLVLILSFRRSFWIAFVVAAIVVILVATGRRGRALLVPAGAVLAAALVLSFTTLGEGQRNSAVVQRVQSLSPDKLQIQAYERYRLDEQRSVWAEIAGRPLTGIGLGVPWRARYPLAITFPGARDYTHAAVLWYWLKLGFLGVIAYVLLIAVAARTGLTVWHRAQDPLVRAAGLAIGASFLALAVAEATGSFFGVDARLTILASVLLGGLAAACLDLPAEPQRRSEDQPARTASPAVRGRR